MYVYPIQCTSFGFKRCRAARRPRLTAGAGSPTALNEKGRSVLTTMVKSALHGLKVTERMEQFLPPAVRLGPRPRLLGKRARPSILQEGP